MNRTEKQMKDVLSQEIRVSETVNQRLQETYEILEKRQKASGKRYSYKKNLHVAAAVAAIVCCAVPTVVYASVKTGFFEGMFGNTTKKSTDVIHTEIDDGKGGKVAVDIPSKEYVAVDEEKADELIGQWVMGEPIVKKIGDHTLTIESFAYDKNGALLYFTLGREGGVKALAGNEETNLTKGAVFTDEADFYFSLNCKDDIFAGENIYIDMEKSTDEMLYCSEYILWSDSLKEGDIPQLSIEKYPCTRGEMYAVSEEEFQEISAEIQTETVALPVKGQIPVKSIDLGEGGYLEYSPVSLSVDMSKGMGLSAEEAQDPYYLQYLEIRYKDGSSYIVSDREKCIENNGYVFGVDTWYKTALNRLVDTDEIAEIIVNEVHFPVE